jgi:hypothetical protein
MPCILTIEFRIKIVKVSLLTLLRRHFFRAYWGWRYFKGSGKRFCLFTVDIESHGGTGTRRKKLNIKTSVASVPLCENLIYGKYLK